MSTTSNGVIEALRSLASVDLFKEGRDPKTFVGRPFYFDYSTVKVLVNDKWKSLVGGIPAGAFLLCSYDAEQGVEEMVLVRVIGPTALPTDPEVIASMVEYYKENPPPGGEGHKKLDSFTRYEFNFSGLECRVLGTYLRTPERRTVFGADLENFYSAHNYSVSSRAARRWSTSSTIARVMGSREALNRYGSAVSDIAPLAATRTAARCQSTSRPSISLASARPCSA